ncbi:M15 family metallopeptidase [Mycobacterium sp. CVI_P3]|uniref:M15 family metallopeptidase n=1 Tax=Mycobacterium pinniadriaticum TaxID=2994102 RepID=A0ABT3SA91_9MYCO|nr:M15 family metallopeptidase [Mycobacterium pinniadriaticum]MCX2929406.1 M15 family metallopeptidase [Mycobacterium pinniadriaticum]MCX2935830.1 M15 family metallopeptidase [Mycobacterium pinniadriaticum]
MRLDLTFVTAGVLGVVATAVMVLGATVAQDSAPRIMLTDNTVSVEPPAVASGDGSLADGQVLTPFDVENPAVGRLDPRLLTAIQQAATAASADGITMTINSSWRSPEFQQRLLDNAVATYGSLAAAREYVETPQASKHVIGEAVDVGGVGADQWLIANGARFGLCRIYANELWHFELATDAAGNCPPLLPNAAG